MTDITDLDLTIGTFIKAPPPMVWRAWAEPDLLKEWWCPKPWTTEVLRFDLRAGGAFHTLMRGPDGETSDNPGLFLEVIPQQRIVMTSMLVEGWRPATPWLGMTAVITMADTRGGTEYRARVMHPDKPTRDRHEQMGFFDGWGTCLRQLADLAGHLA